MFELAIPVVISKLNETLYNDEFVTPSSVQVLYNETFVLPNNIQVLYNETFMRPNNIQVLYNETCVLPNSVDVLYSDAFVTPSNVHILYSDEFAIPNNTLVLYRLVFILFICCCTSDVTFCMYENVCTGILFSVLVNDRFCIHAFKHDMSPIVLICAKYSSNSVYRKLAFPPDKLYTCKSVKLACKPTILPLDMILPLVIKHPLSSMFSCPVTSSVDVHP